MIYISDIQLHKELTRFCKRVGLDLSSKTYDSIKEKIDFKLENAVYHAVQEAVLDTYDEQNPEV